MDQRERMARRDPEKPPPIAAATPLGGGAAGGAGSGPGALYLMWPAAQVNMNRQPGGLTPRVLQALNFQCWHPRAAPSCSCSCSMHFCRSSMLILLLHLASPSSQPSFTSFLSILCSIYYYPHFSSAVSKDSLPHSRNSELQAHRILMGTQSRIVPHPVTYLPH